MLSGIACLPELNGAASAVEVCAWHVQTGRCPQNIWQWKSQGFLWHKLIPFKLLRPQNVQNLKICYDSFKPDVSEQSAEENISQ
jgi:hypothetical protein